jgi:hypothetical protein
MVRIYNSLIQGSFGGRHGNFEALVIQDHRLVHWWRDNTSDDIQWNSTGPISSEIAEYPACLIQSSFQTGGKGNLEAIAPLRAGDGTIGLWHFYRDNTNSNWYKIQLVEANAAGPASMIQSDFRGSSGYGNFELVVPVWAGGKMNLQQYYRDNSAPGTPWHPSLLVAEDVAFGACMIQSSFVGGDGHGNLELVVPLRGEGGTFDLWHFYRETTPTTQVWRRGQRIAVGVTGPGVLLQSDAGTGDHKNFEVIVPVRRELVHFFHDNSNPALPWQRAKVITDATNGYAAMIRSDYGDRHKNFEVLVDECNQTLASYYHENADYDLPWIRLAPPIVEPPPAKSTLGTVRICQLTGEWDRAGWGGAGTAPPAFNHTESSFHIRGTDLGSSFEHGGKLYFLFGDTLRNDRPMDNRDAVAWTTDAALSGGIHLTFLPEPPDLAGVDLSTMNVPLDGFSWGGKMYVFFSADHYQVDNKYDVMGRCVLGRASDEAQHFDSVRTLSTGKFINVTVATQTLDADAAAQLHLAAGTPVLWIWGTGRYRASGIYLAAAPLAGIETFAGIQYFNGYGWSGNENDAASLIWTGDAGELSVRWNPFLARWILLFNSGSPRGILMHTAPQPWGPWTDNPVWVFNPDDGYGRFMHRSSLHLNGHARDFAFDDFQGDNEWGGEYAPYQITRFATGAAGDRTQIYFTMSTWNPYQVMLMTTTVDSTMVDQPLITVPDLQGKTESDAQSALRAAGLAWIVGPTVPGLARPGGPFVGQQEPHGGTSVAPSTKVVYHLANPFWGPPI